MALLDRVEAASALDSISLPLSSMTGGATVFAFRPRLFVVLDIVAGAGDDEVKSSDEVVEVARSNNRAAIALVYRQKERRQQCLLRATVLPIFTILAATATR